MHRYVPMNVPLNISRLMWQFHCNSVLLLVLKIFMVHRSRYLVAWLAFALIYWLISRRDGSQCDLVPDTGSNSTYSVKRWHLYLLNFFC